MSHCTLRLPGTRPQGGICPAWGVNPRRYARNKESRLTLPDPQSILIPMSMTKRIQIPVTEQECSHFQAAARRSRLPLAEWARRQLREKADETLGGTDLTP